MALEIGIVGLPNVGKSTLFNALTSGNALSANYPFATIEPNTGIVPVPDPRLLELQKIYNAKQVIPAVVTFVDIAGLVAGASKGEGLGNQFLANIRNCSAIVHVVRSFVNKDIVHVSDNVSPVDDIEVINTELCLADIQTIEKHLPKVQKESKADPKAREKVKILETARDLLNAGIPLSSELDLMSDTTKEIIDNLQLLSAKPVIYAFNIDEETIANESEKARLASIVSPANSVFICAKLEEELRDLEPNDAQELLESYNVTESGLVQLVHSAYDTLGLQSYLTAGEKEVRAWTIHKGDTAPQAAGVIHSDFEKGFIAVQVIDYNDLVTAGSENAVKSAGKMRTEGRDYVMRPDDVVDFRFNVSK